MTSLTTLTEEELLEHCLKMAAQLCLIRNNVELEADTCTEEEAATDAAQACFGEGTCSGQAIPGVAELLRRLQLGKAAKSLDDGKCGKATEYHLIAGASWYACVLLRGHEGKCKPGGECAVHGLYVCDWPVQCPQWPRCIECSMQRIDANIAANGARGEESSTLLASPPPLAAEESGWILCSERLPPLMEYVDVVIGGIVQVIPAQLEDDSEKCGPQQWWYWADESADSAPFNIVTHWRKRPTFTPVIHRVLEGKP